MNDYSAAEIGSFIGGPLLLMALSLPFYLWPLFLVMLIWAGCALHMFTGWRPRPRKR